MASKGYEDLPIDVRKWRTAFRKLNDRIIALENMRIIVDLKQFGVGDLNVGNTSSECRITGGKETGDI